jgi:hypothetical protein
MIKAFQIIVFLFLVQILCYPQDVVSFDSENITFKIQDNIFMVNGIYYFNSQSNKQFSILYPFPSDSIYGRAFNIKVKYVNTGETIIYKTYKNSSSIVLPVLMKGETPIMISYCQPLKSNKVKYILISTNYWNKPIEKVDYKLITDFEIKKFSMPPDKEIILGNKKIYLWQKENFMPTMDFEIEY